MYVAGWWLNHPEKSWSSSVGMMEFPTERKHKNVPNHQPGSHCSQFLADMIAVLLNFITRDFSARHFGFHPSNSRHTDTIKPVVPS